MSINLTETQKNDVLALANACVKNGKSIEEKISLFRDLNVCKEVEVPIIGLLVASEMEGNTSISLEDFNMSVFVMEEAQKVQVVFESALKESFNQSFNQFFTLLEKNLEEEIKKIEQQ